MTTQLSRGLRNLGVVRAWHAKCLCPHRHDVANLPGGHREVAEKPQRASTRNPTRRQQEVIRTYVRVGTYKAVADEIGIAEQSVKNHMSKALARTGCHNVAQLAVAVECGR